MNCEHCGAPVPKDNIQRVCAYQTEPEITCQDYKCATFCNCCDECRSECNEAAKITNPQK